MAPEADPLPPAAPPREALRVLGWPAFRHRAAQPYTWLLYTHLRELGADVREYTVGELLRGAHVLHLHWPDKRVRDDSRLVAWARAVSLLRLMDLAHLRGTRIFWTVHNLQAHSGREHPALERAFWRSFIRRLDGVLSLSPSGLDAARARYPALREVPAFITPHGHYRGAYPDTVGRDEARRTLALPAAARVAAFVGQVREYKNVPQLVRAFRGLPAPELALLVAGRPASPKAAGEIRAEADGDSRVHLHLNFVREEKMQYFLRAADVVVLPYREILNSGSAILALSFDRPVLVPHKGAMADLAAQVGPEWVRTYEGELTPAVLSAALEWASAPGRPARPDLRALEWSQVAHLTLEAYRAVAR